jgi:hypothetical protein
MNSVEKVKKNTTRGEFLREVTLGAAVVTIAGVLAGSEAVPILRAQARKETASALLTAGIAPSKSKYAKYFSEESRPGKMPAYGTDQNFYFDFQFIKSATSMHDPHTHPHVEILGFFSSDPSSPDDLGAEVVMTMGEELERVVMTRPTVLFLPPDTIHSPLIFQNVVRPVIFIATAPVAKLVEKSYAYLLPGDQRRKPKSKTP